MTKALSLVVFVLAAATATTAQDFAQKVYDTEREFERAVGEKGINVGFAEFLSPLGIIFSPEPVNGRERMRSRPPSVAALTWNPIKIETSSNGALAYSIGNSILRPKGKDDSNEIHGHYLSIWTRQPNGDYRAALDTGIHHEKPVKLEPNWTSGSAAAVEANPKNLFAGDSSISFYRMAENRGIARAYKAHAADDIVLLREGKLPFVGRDAAVDFLGDQKLAIKYVKRRSFIEAGDLAYVYSNYTLFDKDGGEKEKGNFIQVWKLRGGKWLIAADVFVPIPPAKN